MTSVDLIRHVKLSTARLPLAVPISDAKVFTGRQKPMTARVSWGNPIIVGTRCQTRRLMPSVWSSPGWDIVVRRS